MLFLDYAGAMLLLFLMQAAVPPTGPAKLVIATANGVAITDYPSAARCERARVEFLVAWRKEAEASAPPGYHLVEASAPRAICIPG